MLLCKIVPNGSGKKYYDKWLLFMHISEVQTKRLMMCMCIPGSVRLSARGKLERKTSPFNFFLTFFFFAPNRKKRRASFHFHRFARPVLHCSYTDAESFSGWRWRRWNINGIRKIRCDFLPFCRFTVIRFLGAASAWFLEQSRIIFYSCIPLTLLPPPANLLALWPELWEGARPLHCASISPVSPTLCPPPRHCAQSKSNTSG